MFEDEKIDFIESLPECDAILVVWLKLLTLAGRCNAGGFIFLTEKIPYNTEMLAHTFRRPLNTVKLALKTLHELEMIEFDDEEFLKISNWEKHQNIEGLEKIRMQTRERVKRHRGRKKIEQKENVTLHVTQCNATDIEEDIDKELDIDKDKYNIVFSTYNEQEIINHRTLTSKMKQAINRALKKDKQEDILKAIKRYGQAFRDPNYQFCKYKMTLDKFLTQGNGYYDWLDEGQKWINYSDFKSKGGNANGIKQSPDGEGPEKIIFDKSKFLATGGSGQAEDYGDLI